MAKEAGRETGGVDPCPRWQGLAQQAAFVNGVMARALDFCDAVVPGTPGTAIIPAALAAAELAGAEMAVAEAAVAAGSGGAGSAGRVSGADFLTAVAMGTEVALRLNLGEAEYDGFDPTGVCVPFGSTAAASKILGLSEVQTWNALALAFCRCGGSFQANVDGALAVRVIEGWAAETGVTCARLAARDITGPVNFLEGVYGYLRLFGRDRVAGASIVSGLGPDYLARNLVFKKFPSCGATQASTQMILDLMAEEGFGADDVECVEIVVPPYIHRLVGHPFKVGTNPKVSAQFSIRYCVANALSRKASCLAHFEDDAIRDPGVLQLVERIEVTPDAAMDARGHTAVDMRVIAKPAESTCDRPMSLRISRKPSLQEEHLRRFRIASSSRRDPCPGEDAGDHLRPRLDEIEDVRSWCRCCSKHDTRRER
jgi:2-methylcitrate dehydratase PrpD